MTGNNEKFPNKNIDYKANPDEYKYTPNEVGVLIVKPYKNHILPHWKLVDPESAKKSAQKIYDIFIKYLDRDDYVGADMARKYLQMGLEKKEWSDTFKKFYDKVIKNNKYKEWVEVKNYLQKRPRYDSFLKMHKDLKMHGSYRYGLVTKDDKIVRLIINYHKTSPDKFSQDLKTIYYAGRGKKNIKYERIADQISDPKYYKENQTIIKHKTGFDVYAKFWFLKDAYYLGKYKYQSHIIKKHGRIRYYYIKLVRSTPA